MKNIKKVWLNTLCFLDNSIINTIIVIVLVLYSSGIFENINYFIGNIYNFSIIRIIVLLLIIYLAPKDITIAILLSLSYIVSMHYMKNSEHFYSGKEFISDEEHKMYKDVKLPSPDKIVKFPSHFESPQKNKEEFFNYNQLEEPIIHDNNSNNNNNNIVDNNNHPSINNFLPESTCRKMYEPKYEEINNVCNPVATFKNEFNPQGLNYPEGFNDETIGAPIN